MAAVLAVAVIYIGMGEQWRQRPFVTSVRSQQPLFRLLDSSILNRKEYYSRLFCYKYATRFYSPFSPERNHRV